MEIRQGNLENNLKDISGVQVTQRIARDAAEPRTLHGCPQGLRAPARSQDTQATGRVRQG